MVVTYLVILNLYLNRISVKEKRRHNRPFRTLSTVELFDQSLLFVNDGTIRGRVRTTKTGNRQVACVEFVCFDGLSTVQSYFHSPDQG